MKEVYPSIFVITEKGGLGAIKPPENIYVIAGKNGLIFDAGYGNITAIKHVVRNIYKIKAVYKQKHQPFEITRILPSHVHPDHFSGLKKLKKYLGVKILLTEKMANALKDKNSYRNFYESNDVAKEEYQGATLKNRLRNLLRKIFSRLFYRFIYGLSFIENPDKIVEENSFITINDDPWKIISSPGHSSDHISLYNEEKGVLFSGDNILRTITTWLGPPNSDIKEYNNTMKKIKNLPHLKLILPAHGSPIKNPKERIEEIIAHRRERTNQVLNLINKKANLGITIDQMIQNLYQDRSSFMHGVARGWIVLTLQMLEEQDLIYSEHKNNEIIFFPTNK